MRKLVLFTAILASFVVNAVAQTFYPVTHTTGTQVVSGVSVTVTNSTGRTNNPATTFCSAGPYYIGVSQPGGYVHSFAPGITHIRLSITDFQSEDSVRVNVNGSSFPITAAMLADYACPDPGGPLNNMSVFNGMVVNTLGGAARRDVTVTFSTSPGYINNVEVLHDRTNSSANGVVYGLEFALDTCLQKFDAWTSDTVQCRTRDLHLFSTQFPNTTYSWTGPGTPIWVPSNTVDNPVVKSLQLPASSGNYIVTATRGVCTYKDTVVVTVEQTPTTSAGSMSYQGPKCVGDKDTVRFVSGLPSGGTTYIIKPDGSVITCILPSTFDFIELSNIQLSDAGTYRGYSKNTEGCISDTGSVIVTLSPQAQADFLFNTKLGCDADTVVFSDQSNGVNTWKWNFGDGNTSAIDNPTHIYTPASSGTFPVKLVVSNGTCADSITKQVVLNHPLTADFTMSADSICQGKPIIFTNNSTATPATLPTYLWDFKDGQTSDQYNITHIFTNYGVYDIEMTITDYLGCKKTATKRLVVDSLGSANFLSDSVICAGQSIDFKGDYSTIGGTYAEWDFGDGHLIKDKFTIEHAYDEAGTYNVKLTANYRICPDTTYNQNVYVKPYPIVDLGKDTSICPDGKSFIIKDFINDGATGVKWSWNTETKDTVSSINVHHPGKYAVTVDLDGCVTVDTIEVKKNCYIDIPNVFTPNGDGYNDYFLPRQLLSRSVTKFSMTIFNRWGEVIFETNSINGRGWDGKVNDKEQPTGVYVYMIKATFANGYSENYQGNVTLLR